jgi:hypothetical protein
MECVRDRFWIWGHEAGSHDKGWDTPKPSRMTPAEGAFYLGVPNIIMIRYDDKPAMPFDQYALAFRPLKKVVWSITGAGGVTSEDERNHVLELAKRFPNIVGVFMDDFFTGSGEGVLSIDELKSIRNQLTVSGRRLDLMVTVYTHNLDTPLTGKYLEVCDVASIWTWSATDLANMESSFEKFAKVAPDCRKLLGCYMWDYGTHQPMPIDLMQMQCETGLRWLKDGQIEGMIFLASCICDLELDAVEWTRNWIAKVGDESL